MPKDQNGRYEALRRYSFARGARMPLHLGTSDPRRTNDAEGDPGAALVAAAQEYSLAHPGMSFRASLAAISASGEGALLLQRYNQRAVTRSAQPRSRSVDRRYAAVEASVEIDERARAYCEKHSETNYRTAVTRILEKDPELAARWINGRR